MKELDPRFAFAPLMTEYDNVIKATAALVRRAGAIEFRVEHSTVPSSSNWIATAMFERGEQKQGLGVDPRIACDRLAVELLDGSVCRRCNHVITVYGNDGTFCHWCRRGDVWVAGCGRPVDTNIDMVART